MRVWIAVVAGLIGAVPVAAQPASAPGTLIDASPVASAPAGMRAWRVRYWTSDDDGRPIAVTGMVIAPAGPPRDRARPVIAWAHGTWGVDESCAPSTSPDFFAATPGLADAVARGYAVAAPDYPGLGSPMPHPYLVGESAVRSTLDAVRAARAIPEATAGPDFAVWGESQGAHAALWTGLRARYAPDLRLAAVAAAAPPTDLVANLRQASDPSARAFLTAFLAHSWSQHYRVPLAGIGRRGTPALIARLARRCVVLNKTPRLGTLLGILALRRDLKDVDLGARQPWARLAAQNSVAARDPGVPVLIAQTVKDPLVAPAVTRDYVRRLCAARARVRWIELPGGDHSRSARDSATATLDWIADRFAGRPAPDDCRRL